LIALNSSFAYLIDKLFYSEWKKRKKSSLFDRVHDQSLVLGAVVAAASWLDFIPTIKIST
jgi:hypothetical protein